MSEHSPGACDDCGGTGAAAARPRNAPGLTALSYRAGTHGTFLERMLRRLASQTVPRDDPADTRPPPRPLSRLTTRAADDPAIALLDAWATTADVLTFYQERIANEGYLRTATERRSVLELARTIGYELNPGVAAGTALAFTLESAKVAPLTAATPVPASLMLPAGIRVQSVPGPDEKAQIFETAEEVEARPEWNRLIPRRTRPQGLETGERQLYLAGVQTGVQVGDALLLVGRERERYGGSERWDFRFVSAVEVDAAAGWTRVEWTEGLGFDTGRRHVPPAEDPTVHVFRQRGALFGFNAPDWRAMPDTIKLAFDPPNSDSERRAATDGRYTGNRTQWPRFESEGEDGLLDLDALYPKALPGSWIILTKHNYTELYRITRSIPAARADFTLTGRVTRLELDAREHLSWFPRRGTVVYLESEQLSFAAAPDYTLLGGDVVELEEVVDGLEAGRSLIVSGYRRRARVGDAAGTLALVGEDGSAERLAPGEVLWMLAPAEQVGDTLRWMLRTRAGLEGTLDAAPGELVEMAPDQEEDPLLSEVCTLERVTSDGVRTTLELTDPLTRWYDRGTTWLWGNVAAATHGETVREVLGSGDGSRTHQRMELKRAPLTYVSAASASGAVGTLEVRVNDLLWTEVPSFYESGLASEVYTVRHADDGTVTVRFGDGVRGARLPTGQANVTATYRAGIGPEGEVRSGALALLQTRPLGLQEVTNPLAASGAAAPEALDDARANAPLTVLTLDRIVSLQDFEDFARAFAGIGKARAVPLWSGERQGVHLTVASTAGAELVPGSALHANLTAAIDGHREGGERVLLDSFERRTFRVAAGLRIHPSHIPATVLETAEAALRMAFSFAARDFAQPVTGAEVLAVLQGVEGVVSVHLDELVLADATVADALPAATVLPALSTRWSGDSIEPSQLLLVDEDGIDLYEVTA